MSEVFQDSPFALKMELCAEAKWQSILSNHMGMGMWGWQAGLNGDPVIIP